MEIGAVKQAFNEELIRLKKSLNQAKIQVIHKLTRKAKVVSERKVPQNIQEKYKRKAKSAVDEVLIIKKIKVKDLAYFTLTHKGELKSFLNKPQVDSNKACARLLLHKVLQEKYKFIRTKFANMPVRDLMMSREERRKLKKEFKTKKKPNEKNSKQKTSEECEIDSNVENREDKKSAEVNISDSKSESDYCSETESDSSCVEDLEQNIDDGPITNNNDLDKEKLLNTEVVTKTVQKNLEPSNKIKTNTPEKKRKHQSAKNKNLKEKLLKRNFKKDTAESSMLEKKIVDPFFITSTGENYLSIAEPRPPDEIKEFHKQGNRKIRRATMFGRVVKLKSKKNFFHDTETKHQSSFRKTDSGKRLSSDITMKDFKDKRKTKDINKSEEKVEEKLHPSWEAKKKQSSIVPFKGKKIVFYDD